MDRRNATTSGSRSRACSSSAGAAVVVTAAAYGPVRPWRTGPEPGSAVDGALELGLGHLRPALDVLVLRLLVELVARPASRPLVRPQPAAAAGGDVLGGRLRRRLGLAGARPLLVHGAGRDLLGQVLGPA